MGTLGGCAPYGHPSFQPQQAWPQLHCPKELCSILEWTSAVGARFLFLGGTWARKPRRRRVAQTALKSHLKRCPLAHSPTRRRVAISINDDVVASRQRERCKLRARRKKTISGEQVQSGIDAFVGDDMEWFDTSDSIYILQNSQKDAVEGHAHQGMDNSAIAGKPDINSVLTVVLEIIPQLNVKLANRLIRSLIKPIETPLPFSNLSEYHSYIEQQSGRAVMQETKLLTVKGRQCCVHHATNTKKLLQEMLNKIGCGSIAFTPETRVSSDGSRIYGHLVYGEWMAEVYVRLTINRCLYRLYLRLIYCTCLAPGKSKSKISRCRASSNSLLQ